MKYNLTWPYGIWPAFLNRFCPNTHAFTIIECSTLPVVSKRLEEVAHVPAQAVLFCEALFWSREVSRIVETKSFQDFSSLLNYFNRSISELSSGQMANTEHTDMYRKLILWMICSRDTTQELMEIKSLNEISYEWLRTLRYSYTKKNSALVLNDAEETRSISTKSR